MAGLAILHTCWGANTHCYAYLKYALLSPRSCATQQRSHLGPGGQAVTQTPWGFGQRLATLLQPCMYLPRSTKCRSLFWVVAPLAALLTIEQQDACVEAAGHLQRTRTGTYLARIS